MTIEIYLKSDKDLYVENLKEIKAFPVPDSNKGIITIKPEDFCFNEYCQYHFIGDTTAIVPGKSISWVMFN